MHEGCSPGDVLRDAADAVIAIDSQRRILGMNPMAEALTGLKEAEALGRPCAEVLHASLCNGRCPFGRAFEKEEQVTSFDVRVVNRAGERIPVCINASVLRNGRGEKIGVVESIRDVRHILKLIHEAEKLASWLEAVLESISDAVITSDLECRITSFNRAAETMTGYRREEVLGEVCKEVFKPDFCPLELTLEQGHGLPESELNLRAKDGSLVPAWLSTEVLRGENGKVIGAVQILRDRREVRRLKEQFRESHGLDRLIGKSACMRAVFQRIERVAPTDSTVLICGESGTGKELVAEILHAHSPRWDKPLIKVNCAALPETLLESELFGHVRGAFTGAVADRPGRFELAHRGTLFLDEAGDLPLPLQVKLLRVLQQREFERVGSTKTIQVDVRIVAATNRDLAALVEQGAFRQDLYYRLHVVPVDLPPLREHPEDIPLLAENFLSQMAARTGKRAKQLTPQALKLLLDHPWPGNVRELENALEYAVVTSEDDFLRPEDLPSRLRQRPPSANGSLATALSLTEKDSLLAALRASSTVEEAAHRLGIGRATLWRKMKRYGVSSVKRDSHS
jgi:PAS domain S-box-containing protein